MEKTVTINGKMVTGHFVDSAKINELPVDRKNHVKVWREIYQDVRRQWAEAELTSPRGLKIGNNR